MRTTGLRIILALYSVASLGCAQELMRKQVSPEIAKINAIRDEGRWEEALALYEEACGKAQPVEAASCRLNYGYLIEVWTDADAARAEKANIHWSDAVSQYDLAAAVGTPYQQGLAMNNAAALALRQLRKPGAGSTEFGPEKAAYLLKRMTAYLAFAPAADRERKAALYVNLADGWSQLEDWSAAFEAYRLALSAGAAQDSVENGLLEALKHLHDARKTSIAADLMIGLNSGAAAAELISKALPYIKPDYDWTLVYSPTRWFNRRRPWPAVGETLLQSLEAASTTPEEFRRLYWKPALNDARLLPGIGHAKLRSALDALDQVYGATSVPDKEKPRVIRSLRDVPPGIRDVTDRLSMSNALNRVGDSLALAFPKEPGLSLWRYSAAWMMYPNNIYAAVSTARIIKDSPVAFAPRLQGELWRTYVIPRRFRWARFLLGILRDREPTFEAPGADLANLYSALHSLQPDNASLVEAVQRHIRQAPAPDLYLLLGKLVQESNPHLAADAYVGALRGFVAQNRDQEAAEAARGIRSVNPDRLSDGVPVPDLNRTSTGFVVRLAANQNQVALDVAFTPLDCAKVDSVERIDNSGLFRVSLVSTLETCTSVEVGLGGYRRSLTVVTRDAQFDPLHDRDLVITGNAGAATDIIEVTVHFNEFEPKDHFLTFPDPTGRFYVRLRKQLVSGQKVELKGRMGGELDHLTDAPVLPLEPDWGATRLYISAGAAIQFRTLSHVSNLLFSINVDSNLHTWSTKNLVVAERGAPQSSAAVLLDAYAQIGHWPLLTTAYSCVNQINCSVKLVPASSRATEEFGMYAPVVLRRLTRPIRGVSNGYFLAPVAKGGIQDIPSASDRNLVSPPGSHPFWAAGLRIGQLKFLSSRNAVSPSLLSYLDVTVGRWNRFGIPTDSAGIRVPTRYEATGLVKLPHSPFSVGFLVNFRQGLDEHTLFVSLRSDVFKEVARVRKEIAKPFTGRNSY